jgi:hypothetical protein
VVCGEVEALAGPVPGGGGAWGHVELAVGAVASLLAVVLIAYGWPAARAKRDQRAGSATLPLRRQLILSSGEAEAEIPRYWRHRNPSHRRRGGNWRARAACERCRLPGTVLDVVAPAGLWHSRSRTPISSATTSRAVIRACERSTCVGLMPL